MAIIQLRRDTAANWAANNPVLANGEPSLETDTGIEKSGNGVTAYNSLPAKNPFTNAEKTKLASLDTRNGAPVQSTAELIAINQSTLGDKEKRFVENEGGDFYYDAQNVGPADVDHLAPHDQAGGVGFWVRIAVGAGETAASVKTKYESNPDTNAYTDAAVTAVGTIPNKADKDDAITNGHLLRKKAGGAYESAGVTVADLAFSDFETLADQNTITFTKGGGTMTTNTNRSITAISGIPGGGVALLRVVGTGTLDFNNLTGLRYQGTLTKKATTDYLVKIINAGTTASPVYYVMDADGGVGGESSPVGLGAFTGSAMTLNSKGFYNPLTVTNNLPLTFAASGHTEGSKRNVKLTFDGTDILSVTAPQGININTIGFQSVTPITAGTYMLYMAIEGAEITVELKAIAVITTTEIMRDDFPTGALDTATKWGITNANWWIDFACVNNELQIDSSGAYGSSFGQDFAESQDSISGECSVAIDFVSHSNGFVGLNVRTGIWVDDNNWASFAIKDAGGKMLFSIRANGTTGNYVESSTVATGKKYRVSQDASNKIQYWELNGGVWAELDSGTNKVYNLGATKKARIIPWNTSGVINHLNLDNFRFENKANYTTPLPD